MLDRAWTVVGRVAKTSQAHGNVAPVRRLYPGFKDTRLGGAGMGAAALNQHPGVSVHVLGNCSERDLPVFESLGLVDARGEVPADGIPFHRLVPGDGQRRPFTTVKFRVYDESTAGGAPVLAYRFDQDPSESATWELPPTLPTDDVDAIVVSDFSKGAVTQGVISQLVGRYPDVKWFVDSKDDDLFELFRRLPERDVTVLVNRTEAVRLCRRTDAFSGSPIGMSPATRRKALLDCGLCLLERRKGWAFVIKLDEDGACCFWREEEVPQMATAKATTIDAPGIAAGDHFLAKWVQASLEGEESLQRLLELATGEATRWVYVSERLFWEEGANVRKRRELPEAADLQDPELSKSKGPGFIAAVSKPVSVVEESENLKSAFEFPAMLYRADPERPVLRLEEGRQYLGGFLSVDPERGRQLTKIKEAIESYFGSEGQTRPLNCLLWAEPGSGKSFLAHQLAERVGGDVREVNLARCTSGRDLYGELAAVVGNRPDKLILMLDEVDSPLGDGKFYQYLLSPLWDGKVVYRGREYDLGKRFVSILVTSTTGDGVENAADFLRQLKKAPKGLDLASRLTGPVVTLGELTDADKALIIGSLLRRYLGIHEIALGGLEYLVRSPLSPRPLEYLVAHLKPRVRDGRFTKSDFERLVRFEDALERLGLDVEKLRRALREDDFDTLVVIDG